MTDSAVLKSFLIELGWKIDESSGSKFTNSIVKATAEVTAFATAVEGAAALVVKGVAGMADQLEDLYFASKRTGASAENIRTFGFAAERLGSSVAGARGSLEAFRNFLGSTPAASGLLASFGINPNQDPTKLLEDFGDHLRTLPEYMQRIRAEQFGIDWHTALALMDKDFRLIQDDSDKTFKLFGINMDDATKRSHVFNTQFKLLLNVFDAIRTKVTDVLQQRLGADLVRFTELLKLNRKEIGDFIEKVATSTLFAGEALLRGIVRAVDFFKTIYDWYNQLDQPTKDFIIRIGEIAAGFALINRILAINPFVVLTAGILLLIEDYEKWKEGGKHLIPWEVWEPEIERARERFKVLWEYIQYGVEIIGGWQTVAEAFALYFAGSWLVSLATTVASAVIALGPLSLAIGAIVAGIATIKYLVKHKDAINDWGDRNIPGMSWLDKTVNKATGGKIGVSEEDQRRQGSIDASGNRTGNSTSNIQQAWRSLTDNFWSTGSDNWMRNSFDRLITNTGKIASEIEKALIPSAEGTETSAMQDKISDYFANLIGMGSNSQQRGPVSAAGGHVGRSLTPELEQEIRRQAKEKGLDENHMVALAMTEGGGYDNVSPAGAVGTMQIMPSTGAGLGLTRKDLFDFHKNIEAGERYFKQLLEAFHGNYQAADAAYNAGPMGHGVHRFAETGDPSQLPSETQKYVPSIEAARQSLIHRTPATTAPLASSIRIESHLNVNGVHDARTVSDMIIQSQDRMNLEAIRNAQSVVR